MKPSIQRSISPPQLDETSDDLTDSLPDVCIQLGEAVERLTRTIRETETLLGDLAAGSLGPWRARGSTQGGSD